MLPNVTKLYANKKHRDADNMQNWIHMYNLSIYTDNTIIYTPKILLADLQSSCF